MLFPTFARRLAFLLALAALGACSVMPPEPLAHSEGFKPVYPITESQPKQATGAIFNSNRSEAFFGVGRSYVVGDLVSVLLAESTSAARSQNGKLSRKSGVSSGTSGTGLVGKLLGDLGGASVTGNTTHEGTGEANQEQSLTGSVTVAVVEIMPNGNLVLRGEKQLALSEGSEVIQVSGVVRPEDIAPNNTVLSRRLANAQISYRGLGDQNAATRAGWGTAGVMKLWPF